MCEISIPLNPHPDGMLFSLVIDLPRVWGTPFNLDYTGDEDNGTQDDEVGEVSSDVQRKKVLVIDDDPFTLDLLQKMLRSICNVVTATNGVDGIKLIQTSNIDLVLLDWMMPEMDGLSVLIDLMSNEKTKGVPVLFISSKTDQTSIDKALSVGAKDYISKPFHKKDLINIVQAHL